MQSYSAKKLPLKKYAQDGLDVNAYGAGGTVIGTETFDFDTDSNMVVLGFKASLTF